MRWLQLSSRNICRWPLIGLRILNVHFNMEIMQFGLKRVSVSTLRAAAAVAVTGLTPVPPLMCLRSRTVLLFVVVQQMLKVLLKFFRVLHLCSMAYGVVLIKCEQVGCRATLCRMAG